MGITGLLPFLKDASTQINISDLRNYTVAIDTYCWLHKGAFGCAEKLARGEDTNGYVLYCLKYIKMLQQFNIKPIMVFDGQHLPAKKATEEKRRQQRAESKKRAQQLLRLGKSSEAYSYIRRSIDITHKMALNLIKECRNMGIDCIVAPYEADSQLAYLNMSGVCQAVISEDSDLVLFGCKKIVYKLDLQGQATLVNAENIPMCMKLRPDVYTFDKFRHMCILSGCDYLDSLPGVGIKKALKFISMTANPSIFDVLPKLPFYLKIKELEVSDEYREQFLVAEATFRHQVVYDPIGRKLLHLTDPYTIGTKEEHLVNAGTFYDVDLAFKMALGNVDPFSLKVLDNWVPTRNNINGRSIWSGTYQKPVDLPKLPAFPINGKQAEFKIKAPSKNEVDQQKLEEDQQLEKELSTYLKNEPVKRKREEVSEAPLSPILRKEIYNPFKKISKFKRTEINSNEVKISRYFLRRGQSDDSLKVNSIKNIEEENEQCVIKEEIDTEERIVTNEEVHQVEEIKVEEIARIVDRDSPKRTISPLLENRNIRKLKSFILESKHKLMVNTRNSSESKNEASDLENETPPNSQGGVACEDDIVCVTNELVTKTIGDKTIGHKTIGDKTVSDRREVEVCKPSQKKNVQSVNRFIRRTKSANSTAGNAKKQKEVPKNQRTLLSMFKFSQPTKLT